MCEGACDVRVRERERERESSQKRKEKEGVLICSVYTDSVAATLGKRHLYTHASKKENAQTIRII